MKFEAGLSHAQSLDQQDPLRSYRNEFYFPQHNGKDVIYFCGNSLGLQPKGVKDALEYELELWKKHAVEGHFLGKTPWLYYHKFLLPQSAQIVGAKAEEVIVMNTLTTNLHLMMVSFYRPTPKRFKIIMEAGAFPSDQYAMESQVKYHGFDPETAIIEIAPKQGESIIRMEDILAAIEEHGKELALIMFAGVNYYNGQFFNLEVITEAGHRVGAMVGFDLAHTAGNLPLRLHDWNVDFAVWCSYKYLNSGPGGPGGVFVHERHGNKPGLPRFAGWWGHNEEARFLMRKGFLPMQGAAGWQLSNAQIFSFAAHKVSLDLFAEVGMEALRKKSIKLTAFLEFLIARLNKNGFDYNIITPKSLKERGCQLSILTGPGGRELFDYLSNKGVVADWREANLPDSQTGVIRVAPVPFYNSFQDVFEFAELLRKYVAVR